ncbi:uncharacterized protein ACMZJ9_023124 [Mantella aurantiaca]
MVKWARLNSRKFQMGFLRQWKSEDLTQEIQILPRMREDLMWRSVRRNLTSPHSLLPVRWVVLTSDASKTGWGATCHGVMAQGKWRSAVKGTVSNIFELRAALQAVRSFTDSLRGKAVMIRMDNGHGSVLREESRGHVQPHAPKGGRANHGLGPVQCATTISSIPTRRPEPASRLPLMTTAGQQRVVTEPPGIPGDSGRDVSATDGPVCLAENAKLPQFMSRLPCQQALAVDAPWPCERAYAFPQFHWPHPSPSSREAEAKGVDVDRSRLTELGCTPQDVNTLLQSWKGSTSKAYQRAWKKFREFAEAHLFQPENPGVTNVLDFLQAGLDLGLGLSTLRGQVSAISAFSGARWALDPLVTRFFRAVITIRPPRSLPFPKWDLNVVLDLLSTGTFAANQDLSLWKLTLKTAFLLAITVAGRVFELAALGAAEPFTTVFGDKVVLVPVKEFLPKVVSCFHLRREITLPRMCIQDGNARDPLDVGSTLETYLESTLPIRRSERLFIVPAGAKKGGAASSRTIASWIVKTIRLAYESKGLRPPDRIRAHSTRGMATSWAAAGGMSLEDICRAASWSSKNTFISHYCLEPASLTSARFGQLVLATARSMTNSQVQNPNKKDRTVEKDEVNLQLDDSCPVFQLMPNKNTSDEVSCKRVEFAPGSCRLMKSIFRDKPADCTHQQTHIICQVSNSKEVHVYCHQDICKRFSYVAIGLYISDLGKYRWHRLNSTEELETFINLELLIGYNPRYPNHGYCIIQCDTNDGRYASQLLVLPPALHGSSKQMTTIHSRRPLLNVNILLLDSLSRHHFYRSLPKTIQEFRNLNEKHFKAGHVFDFELFQGIKSHTLESLQALFEGIKFFNNLFNASGVRQKIVDLNETLGNFKAFGYETLYVEDLCWLFEWGLVKEQGAMNLTAPYPERVKLFNEALHRAGIDRVDVTYTSCLVLKENKVKNSFHGPSSVCYNGIHQHTYLLQYVEYFMNRFNSLNRPTFTFMMLDTAHEDTGIRIKQIDEDLARHVSFLAHQENTVSFILSDHGNTYGRFLSVSPESYVEIFHPSLFMIVPDFAFKIIGKTKMKALHINQRRLVSLIDVHYTLKGLLPNIKLFDGNILKYNVNNDGLLSPVSPLRKCSDIPRLHPNLCICQGSYTTENNSYYSLFAEFALNCINKRIAEQQKDNKGSCLALIATRFDNVKISMDNGVGGTIIALDIYVKSSYSDQYDQDRFTVTMVFDSTSQREGILFLGYHRLTPYSIYQSCANPSVDLNICICERNQGLGKKTKQLDILPETVLWTKTYKAMVHKPCLSLNTRNYTAGVVLSVSNACPDRKYVIIFTFLSKNLFSSEKMPVNEIVGPTTEKLLVVGIRKKENLQWRYKYTMKYKIVPVQQ